MENDIMSDMCSLSLDDRFLILLHKKIMNKKGSAKRRAKKYYKDLYKKNGVIPEPLKLAGKGVFEGRKCSGRKQVLDEEVKKRFVEMVKASCDITDESFIFISCKGRKIKNYHVWLEKEFGRPIYIGALRRFVNRSNLKKYLEKPDYGENETVQYSFKSEPVFGLLQVDGCKATYMKIRDATGNWRKPIVIEVYDTRSRNMFAIDGFFSESSKNAVSLFSKFLLSSEFPSQKMRLRPDNAGAFLNLKRVINELNLRYSLPGGFYLEADFSRAGAPKDKAHLESSHRALHNFEMRIIKLYEDKIVKTEPCYSFKNNKKEKITVTFLDVGLEELRKDNVFELYRMEHNRSKHYFSEEGRTAGWVPEQKLDDYLSKFDTISFTPDMVNDLMKYGYKKVKANVSKQGIITFGNQKYYVATGTEKFSRHKSTPVAISCAENGKLFIFEPKADGLLIGEALKQKPFSKPVESNIEENEVEKIGRFLETKNMVIDWPSLIEQHNKGLSLKDSVMIYQNNKERYEQYAIKMKQGAQRKGKAIFNAFIMDCERQWRRAAVAPYAAFGE